ncbi:hypothetical protein NE237_032543 [Protea cynaroides]|uniref:rRNA methylase n=1 Tax=Protea cynaroides TaxID=273540 RepID=A0A9Q0L467_9MAGN|nr:hypothetical protein NE237_032543 [Protea cynaroides]
MFASLRFQTLASPLKQTLVLAHTFNSLRRGSRFLQAQGKSKHISFLNKSTDQIHQAGTKPDGFLPSLPEEAFPLSGLEDALMGYISGKKKATEVAHLMWKHIVRKGDTVVDATCGNGHDTLAMVKLVADESNRGCVYGMDIQNIAVENTSLLLDALLNPNERKLVKLFHTCHSRMEDIVPRGTSVRLVALNLGYLPGGDKAVITLSETTLPALEAASRILAPGGLISIIVYVGHPGGRKEFETVQAFASGLPVDDWVCSKFEMINRQTAPVLVILFKK